MKQIILVAETGSDITPELAERYGIKMVPMHVTFGEETLDDGSFPAEKIKEYYQQNAMNWAYEKSAELATRIVEAKDYETFSAARAEFEAFEEAFREQIGGDEYLIFLEESALILNN